MALYYPEKLKQYRRANLALHAGIFAFILAICFIAYICISNLIVLAILAAVLILDFFLLLSMFADQESLWLLYSDQIILPKKGSTRSYALLGQNFALLQKLFDEPGSSEDFMILFEDKLKLRWNKAATSHLSKFLSKCLANKEAILADARFKRSSALILELDLMKYCVDCATSKNIDCVILIGGPTSLAQSYDGFFGREVETLESL